MLGIDTNILVRYITLDDEQQTKAVTNFLNKYATKPCSILVNNIVLCELVWVLAKGYKYKKEDIVNVLKRIASINAFAFENPQVLDIAIETYKKYPIDFSDALIAYTNTFLGCSSTVTLDQSAAKTNKFKLLILKDKDFELLTPINYEDL